MAPGSHPNFIHLLSMSTPYFITQSGTVSVLLHIPHSSIHIPEEFLGDFVLQGSALEHEAHFMADLHTEHIYRTKDQPYWIQQSAVSRLVVDVERFEDEEQEEMSRYGMAAVYTKTSTGEPLKKISQQRKKEYLLQIFRPYHEALTNAVRKCVDQFGHCTIIDCHSFPSEPRYYEDQTPNRPDICLGTVNGFTPDALTLRSELFFTERGYSVKRNTPFAGSIVPVALMENEFYAPRISTIMLELNRKLYMNEETFEAIPSMTSLSTDVQQYIEHVTLASA